jgi:HSP20 family molecular chaperone IbpA
MMALSRDDFFQDVGDERARMRVEYWYSFYAIEDVEERSIVPLTSVHVQRDRIIVTADMPFVEPSSLMVSLPEERRLHIEAKMRITLSSESLTLCLPSTRFEYFKTDVDLPLPAKRISSVRFYKDILEVVLQRDND